MSDEGKEEEKPLERTAESEPDDNRIMEDVLKIATSSVVTTHLHYNHSKVAGWVSSISDEAIKQLEGLKRPNRKYIVHTSILQKAGAGLHTGHSCFWDPQSDAIHTYKHDNKSMSVVVTAYSILI